MYFLGGVTPARLKTVQYFDYFKLYFNNEKRRGIENKPNVDKIRKKKFHFHELSMWFFMFVSFFSEKLYNCDLCKLQNSNFLDLYEEEEYVVLFLY